MSVAREHTGHGWGDPLDGSKPEIWLCNGYVCVYSPEHSNRVELWTVNGPCDSRFAFTNAGKAANDDAVNRAGRHASFRPYYADDYERAGLDWRVHSRFD